MATTASIRSALSSLGSFDSRRNPFQRSNPGNKRELQFLEQALQRPSSDLTCCAAKRKWQDPFFYGEDPDIVYGKLFTEGGKQPEQEYIPPLDPNSKFGFRKVPQGYTYEIRNLAAKVRNEVRKCLCFVAGGVYENLLFFPVIELLKDRYPGVKIDIVTTERGKQVYEMNKNVSRTWVYEVDKQFIQPATYVEMITMIKHEYYDMIVSTKLAGIGHAIFMWLTDCTRNISYVYPNVNGAGAGPFFISSVEAPRLNLAEGGYHMYRELNEELGKPVKGIPKIEAPVLRVGISSRLRGVIMKKWTEAGLNRGEFIVVHGIQSDSAATMKSKGDEDCLLPIAVWNLIAKSTSKVLAFVIPHEKERIKVKNVVGATSHIVYITTPGQLGALINDSLGVISTNTAAVQLAVALKKPSIALFSSVEKARLFVPEHGESCTSIWSNTGKLIDINVDNVSDVIETTFEESKVLATV